MANSLTCLAQFRPSHLAFLQFQDMQGLPILYLPHLPSALCVITVVYLPLFPSYIFNIT